MPRGLPCAVVEPADSLLRVERSELHTDEQAPVLVESAPEDSFGLLLDVEMRHVQKDGAVSREGERTRMDPLGHPSRLRSTAACFRPFIAAEDAFELRALPCRDRVPRRGPKDGVAPDASREFEPSRAARGA
jgi:hypothetical protein